MNRRSFLINSGLAAAGTFAVGVLGTQAIKPEPKTLKVGQRYEHDLYGMKWVEDPNCPDNMVFVVSHIDHGTKVVTMNLK
jgi:hypothetical protein